MVFLTLLATIVQYRWQPAKWQSGKLWKYLLYLLYLTVIVGGGAYGTSLFQRSWKFFSWVNKPDRIGLSKPAYQSDPNYGFRPKLNTLTSEFYPNGLEIPVYFNERGNREPLEYQDLLDSVPRPPLWLFLGGSFTYGSVCLAEETYPFQVGAMTGNAVVNAGVDNYSFAPMLMLADSLIPLYKPDYVVVHYSPWLVEWALIDTLPLGFGLFSTPYFYKNDRGEIQIHKPLSGSRAMDVDLFRFRRAMGNEGSFSQFLLDVSLPLFIKDDFTRLAIRYRRSTGRVAHPMREREEVVEHLFNQVRTLTEANGGQCIALLMMAGHPLKARREWDIIRNCDGVISVDAEKALVDSLKYLGTTYERAYMHWGTDTVTPMDSHPNALAHRIIAKAILSELKISEGSTANGGKEKTKTSVK